MARRLRIQFPGARYHVLNRGNYRRPVFASAGATQAFEKALGQACGLFRWQVYASVVLSNHFHLALETPEANLVEGMHWLQTTFATRFNRFRREHGHLFQGRYKSLLVQDDAHLLRLADYIHLNPVRAGLVPAAELPEFRASTLWHHLHGSAQPWSVGNSLLRFSEIGAGNDAWRRYAERLVGIAQNKDGDDRMASGAYSSGWAIGTAGWRKALAREHAHAALSPALSGTELEELRRNLWESELEAGLSEVGKTLADVERDAKGVPWKKNVAQRLRRLANAPYRWIAVKLNMGAISSVRAYLSGSSV